MQITSPRQEVASALSALVQALVPGINHIQSDLVKSALVRYKRIPSLDVLKIVFTVNAGTNIIYVYNVQSMP